MNRKATQIALGGVFSALCLAMMFLTGMIPFATYALPAMAGAMLVAVIVENGRKMAVLVYASVSALSVFVVPDREAALMFIVFFGYYPIVKELLERIRSRVVQWILKLALFNVAVVGGYLIAAYVFGMRELLEGMGDLGKYTLQILLAGGNLVFLLYDTLITRYKSVYIYWFKPKFLRR